MGKKQSRLWEKDNMDYCNKRIIDGVGDKIVVEKSFQANV